MKSPEVDAALERAYGRIPGLVGRQCRVEEIEQQSGLRAALHEFAHDAVADCVATLYSKEKNDPEAYVVSAIRYATRNTKKRKRYRRERQTSDKATRNLRDGTHPRYRSPTGEPHHSGHTIDLVNEVKAVARDRTDERILKLLRFDLTFPQVAEKLGIDSSTVFRRVARIREAIKPQATDELDDTIPTPSEDLRRPDRGSPLGRRGCHRSPFAVA